jgi:hypothetical protein
MLKVKSVGWFVENRKVFGEKVEGLIAYLGRHVGRLDRMDVQSYCVDDVIEGMKV